MLLPLVMSHTIVVPRTPAAMSKPFELGTATGPNGTIQADATSLVRDGKRWLPVMGEFHFSRYPATEWREELLKLKAGGINLLATYVFWIHHEEIEGKWRWDGQRDLHKFLSLCKEVGLPVVLRAGPWCHGEVRNGGLPDWVLKQGRTRSDAPAYLALLRTYYAHLAQEIKGMLWKDGGPIVGLQLENEYGGPAQHLLTLKKMAREAGIDVPLYTRTGWPQLRTPMPFGEILPLYGAYSQGFWDRSPDPRSGDYWRGYLFDTKRSDDDIASERQQNGGDELHAARYPFLTCELGGGMMTSYHRRIRIDPTEIDPLILTKLGSGSNLPGYYMVHGGTNPDGELTTLQESQANREWNDLPTKTYDFQTLLGEFGQTREQYHRLRRLHLFLHDWGADLAPMPAFLPDERPQNRNDATLRWSVRSNGRAGFVFVNNYQRFTTMAAKPETQLKIDLPEGPVEFPTVTVPRDTAFFWPFNLPIGGTTLRYATAQPICRLGDTVVFAATKGVPADFAFSGGKVLETTGHLSGNRVTGVRPGHGAAIRLRVGSRTTTVVLLDEADSLRLYKGNFANGERLILSSAGVVFDTGLHLRTSESGSPSLHLFPSPTSLTANGKKIAAKRDGLFGRFDLPWSPQRTHSVQLEKIRDADPARHVPMGLERVADAPKDADFEKAAVWRLHLQPAPGRRLRIHYVGDVARLYEGDHLLTDNFYNGTPFEFGTWRAGADLRLEILPLRKDAPIMLETKPDFGTAETLLRLAGIDVIDERTLQVEP